MFYFMKFGLLSVRQVGFYSEVNEANALSGLMARHTYEVIILDYKQNSDVSEHVKYACT